MKKLYFVLLILLTSFCSCAYSESESFIDFTPNITNKTLSSTSAFTELSSNESARAFVTACLFFDVILSGDKIVQMHANDFIANDSYFGISQEGYIWLGMSCDGYYLNIIYNPQEKIGAYTTRETDVPEALRNIALQAIGNNYKQNWKNNNEMVNQYIISALSSVN